MLENRYQNLPERSFSVWPDRREIADVLFRRVAFLAMGGAVLAAGLVWFLLRPMPYEAEMAFLLKRDRADSLIASQPVSGPPPAAIALENQLASELEILNSRDLLQEVVLNCRLDAGERHATPQLRLEAAVANLKNDLHITPLLKANMIRLRYTSKDRDKSVEVLRELSRAYIDRHLRLRGNAGVKFFGGETDAFRKKLSGAQTTLADFQRRTNIVLLNQQKDLNLHRLAEAEAALRQAETVRAEQRERAGELERTLAALDRRVKTQERKTPNQFTAERLTTLVVELQNKRTELLEKFREEDRLVKQLDKQLEDTRRALQASRDRYGVEETTDVNPLRPTFEADLIRARTETSAASVRAVEAAKQIAAYRAELAHLEAATAEHESLARNVREIENSYLLYAKKFEEARLDQSLDRDLFLNVAVAEPPGSPASRKPKPWAGILGAVSLGLVVLVTAAVTTGKANRYVFTPSSLERVTGIPVVATFPYDRS